VISVAGGDAIMTRVTGVGCALGALMAAFLATADPLRAAASASAVFAIAGERAAQSAPGPGSFAVAFLDQLWHVALDG
jgi:hydroxyethylthiazole kinase